MMDKIKALLEKAGIKPEVAAEIVESLVKYKNTLREQFEKEYTDKSNEAKKICVEETEAHKRELARRLQIFCETKGVAIESALSKQSAIRESAANAKLVQIQSLLSGIAPNGKQNGNSKSIGKLNKKLATVAEARDRAIEKANKQTAIAEKLLAKNKSLESRLINQQKLLEEAKRPVRTGSLDTRKKSNAPSSTRRTLVENQQRLQPPKRKIQSGDFGVETIAESIDSDLI